MYFFIFKSSFLIYTMLPIELVYHIRDYMPWRYRAILVSREWLHGALKGRLRRRRWRDKRRLFSYMNVFGRHYVQMSWRILCTKLLNVQRRARNQHHTLTWKAAARKYFNICRCEGCGCRTYAMVFDIHLCGRCRYRPRLVNCYMLKVYQAKNLGVPKRILDRVPYHQGMGCHLRFWSDIQHALNND